MAGRYGIDPGSNNIRIYHNGQGIGIFEKNMIAIQKKKEVVAVGNDAYDMYERTPANIVVSNPVREGAIADINNMSKIAEALLKKCGCTSGFVRNNSFYIAVPSDISEVEKRAYFDLISHSSFNTHNVYIVEKPIAAAIGEGVLVSSPKGNMIVDMGAGSTEVTIISSGGIVVSRKLKEGGNTINDMICHLVRKRHHLVIGDKTAEYLKLELANCFPVNDSILKVYGRDLITGMPSSTEVDGKLVFDSLKRYYNDVFLLIRSMLEKVPPEIAEHIRERGIFFTGGTSLVPGVDKLFTQGLKINCMISSKPMESTAKGLGMIIEHPMDYRSVAFSLRDATFE